MTSGGGPQSGPYLPALLPASLLPRDPGDVFDARLRRTARDWTVDVACFLLAVLVGAVLLAAAVDDAVDPPSRGLVILDVALGVASCIALWWRRRWPVGVALVLLVPAVLSASATAALAVALFTVAVHRRVGAVVVVTALHLAATAAYFTLRPTEGLPFWLGMALTTAVYAALVAWGMFVRARRQLVWSLRERAERAEAEQLLRAEQARSAERARIAREMHDVLAHRVSLIALHAGGLQVRPDLPPPDVERTAGLIRETARQALEELRSVIGVLRDEKGTDQAPQAPQPTLRDITRLVEDSRRAGARVDLSMEVDELDAAPGPLGRDAYRIVQEALTNVNKHARGTATAVSVTGGPGQGLRVVVSNRLPAGDDAVAPLPGAGMGLVGLSERVALSGGTLSHGPGPDGQFVVTAELRWAP
jgi:signal transduction histidine kinase